MEIVFYGGSFNPVHYGHIALAQSIIQQHLGDRVLMSVTPQNPLKPSANLIDDKERIQLLRLALNNLPNIEVTEIEQSLPKPNYTYNTLEALKQQSPSDHISLLIGADNAVILNKWYRIDDILANHRILIYPRLNIDCSALLKHSNIKIIDAPKLDISSTEIRERILLGKSCEHLIPADVEQYIVQHRLFHKQSD
ncbi:MAG: nicotinate (nicotinamide) nucleotide adenylyltransferase [Bacteroidales bacterium]|nr:nicotinate (nicotinamide) nucleotide adenylyltransferase [Bacteroidales bacterium]